MIDLSLLTKDETVKLVKGRITEYLTEKTPQNGSAYLEITPEGVFLLVAHNGGIVSGEKQRSASSISGIVFGDEKNARMVKKMAKIAGVNVGEKEAQAEEALKEMCDGKNMFLLFLHKAHATTDVVCIKYNKSEYDGGNYMGGKTVDIDLIANSF